ncbi:hypothetical protein G6F46_013143 [Rhizopus delemar]|nr:hypothetical protein G6F46_013143 [Rhizopus delemar]
MNSLVAVGTSAAYAYSVVATFAAGLLPAGTVNVYFEAAAVIVALILLGRYLEARAKGNTSEAIKRLLGLQAKTARVVRDGATIELAIEDVVAGDLIDVGPGDRVPVDGERRTRSRGEKPGRGSRRRHGQPEWRADVPRHQGRQRHCAGADHPHGRAGAGLEAADPGGGRQGHAVVRSGGDAGRAGDLLGLVDLRPIAGAELRAGQRRGGTDHRLPMRDGTGDADLDHGRYRSWRRDGRAVPQGRGLAVPQGRQGGGGGQDRHADQGPPRTQGPYRRLRL